MDNQEQNIIIYNSDDGRARVALMTRDGNVWLNQNQMAELFATSKQNIGQLIGKILRERELDPNSVVKDYFTTASDGKQEKPILTGKGSITALESERRAGLIYNEFNARRKHQDALAADEEDMKYLDELGKVIDKNKEK